MREEREEPFHSESLYSDNQALDWHHDRSSVSPQNPLDGRMETGLQKRRHYNQHSWRKPAIYTFQAERKRNHLIRNKGLKRKSERERKEFSITITLFQPRLLPLLSSLLLLFCLKTTKPPKFSILVSLRRHLMEVCRRTGGPSRPLARALSWVALPLTSPSRMSFWFHSPVITRKPPGRKKDFR